MDLAISGKVKKFVTIRPQIVNLRGASGTVITRTVNIFPEADYPFKILKAEARNGQYINYRLEEIKSDESHYYALTVQNLKEEDGRYFATILLKTDSNIRPELKIRVFGNIFSKKKE